MLDANHAKLTQTGRLVIETVDGKTQMEITGFHGDGTTCRDLVALACAWAMEQLAIELRETMQKPGGGICSIGD